MTANLNDLGVRNRKQLEVCLRFLTRLISQQGLNYKILGTLLHYYLF